MTYVVATEALTMASQLGWRTGVRRRRVGGQDFIIRITQIRPLDSISAALWDLIDGTRTLFEIIEIMDSQKDRLTGYQGMESVIHAAVTLQKLGFVVLADSEQIAYEQTYTAAMLKQSISGLMQHFYSAPGHWQSRLTTSDADKIYQRFVQIFYESEVAQRKNSGMQGISKEAFVTALAFSYLADEEICLKWVGKQFEIRSWHHDLPENKVVILYMNTVYSGDLDNRL